VDAARRLLRRGPGSRSHEFSKKLVLFALFYLAVEVKSRDLDRERVLSARRSSGAWPWPG
jgi:hypothetical protein